MLRRFLRLLGRLCPTKLALNWYFNELCLASGHSGLMQNAEQRRSEIDVANRANMMFRPEASRRRTASCLDWSVSVESGVRQLSRADLPYRQARHMRTVDPDATKWTCATCWHQFSHMRRQLPTLNLNRSAKHWRPVGCIDLRWSMGGSLRHNPDHRRR